MNKLPEINWLRWLTKTKWLAFMRGIAWTGKSLTFHCDSVKLVVSEEISLQLVCYLMVFVCLCFNLFRSKYAICCVLTFHIIHSSDHFSDRGVGAFRSLLNNIDHGSMISFSVIEFITFFFKYDNSQQWLNLQQSSETLWW